jgi:hypothetical protein
MSDARTALSYEERLGTSSWKDAVTNLGIAREHTSRGVMKRDEPRFSEFRFANGHNAGLEIHVRQVKRERFAEP